MFKRTSIIVPDGTYFFACFSWGNINWETILHVGKLGMGRYSVI